MYKEVEENIISMNNQTGNLRRQMDFLKLVTTITKTEIYWLPLTTVWR